MKLACPHCTQILEIAPENVAPLRAQPHFPCPSCGGKMTLPEVVAVPMPKPPPAAKMGGKAPLLSSSKGPGPKFQEQTSPLAPTSTEASAPIPSVETVGRGLNRNLLVLGVAVLVLMGGIGIYLAMAPGGDVHQTREQRVREIIRNQYFTDLIASGATTKKELLGLWDIQPYGGGFIGLSDETCAWEHALELAKRSGASVLKLDSAEAASRAPMLGWLADVSADLDGSTLWILDGGEPKALHAPEVSRVTTLDRPRRVLLAWDGRITVQ
ncbi:MAG: hypothetical protein IT576_09575 [Verrucomicrobiales bacterium]|nr:hypothetical protein [Verrucomicrobiales bacterium]